MDTPTASPGGILNAEQALLGAMLVDMRSMPAALKHITRDDFAGSENRRIFDAMMRVHADGQPVTVASVGIALSFAPDYMAILTYCEGWTGACLCTEWFAEQLKLQALERLQTEGYTRAATLPPAEGLAEVRRINDEIERRSAPFVEWHNQGDTWMDTYSEIMGPADKDNLAISTGVPSLNAGIGGLRRGSLIVIGARPGVGKSSLSVTIAKDVAFRQGLPVLFISLEMTTREIQRKLISQQTGIPTKRLESHQMTDAEIDAVNAAMDTVTSAPLVIVSPGDDTPAGRKRLTVESLSDVAAEVAAAKGQLGLIIVDYIQLCETTQRTDNRVGEIGAITSALRRMALERKCPVLAPSQLNREGAGREPSLTNLRESGTIEQDAAVVLMLTAPDEPEGPVIEVSCRVVKNRFGERCAFPLRYDGPTQSFGSYTRLDIQGQRGAA